MQIQNILAHGSRTPNCDSQINTPLYPLWPPTGQRNLQEPPLPPPWRRNRIFATPKTRCNYATQWQNWYMLAQYSPSASRAHDYPSPPSHIDRSYFADMAMNSVTLVLVSLLFNAVDALTIGNSHSLRARNKNPDNYPPGTRSDTLIPRISYGGSSYGRGKRTNKNYIIAFSLVGAALVAGFVTWLILRYRRRKAIGKDSLNRKGPPVADTRGGNL